jgi:SAM-dependent methyltransferase
MFDESYFKKRIHLAWRSKIVCSALLQVFQPTSVLDIGCSVGDLVGGLRDLGVSAAGVDKSENVIPHLVCGAVGSVVVLDASQPLETWGSTIKNKEWDLAMCFEVLGVVSPDEARAILGNMAQLSRRLLIGVDEDKFNDFSTLTDSGFEERPELISAFRVLLDPYKRKQAIKAIYYASKFFQRR